MSRPRTALAILLSLLLIVAQQAAGAHLIGHLGEMLARADVGAAQPGVDTRQDSRNGDGHGGALHLSHACSTCVSVAALACAMPAHALPLLAGGGAYATPALAPRAAPAAPAPYPYHARAPPAVS